MYLLSLIVFTSLAGLAGTWFVTGGEPVISVLVAFAIALSWGVQWGRLEAAYIETHFHKARKKLRVWGSSMGRTEVTLVQLWMAVEERDEGRVQDALENAADLGLGVFAHAWARGIERWVSGDAQGAHEAFCAGAEGTQGLDRMELQVWAALMALYARSGDDDGDSEQIRKAGALLGAAARTGRSMERPSDRHRFRYVEALDELTRGVYSVYSGRIPEGRRHLNQAQQMARNTPSLRAKRLALLARIEELTAVARVEGIRVAREKAHVLVRRAVLPGLRVRLQRVRAEFREIENEASPKVGRRGNRPPTPPQPEQQTIDDEPLTLSIED